jgi:hypothetical protein
MWFVTRQSLIAVDRVLANPPVALSAELASLGPDVSRQMLRHEALEFNRHATETWEMLQLGIGGALLATSLLTAHRSRILIGCSVAMLVLVGIMGFVLTPLMNGLGRSFDFLAATAGLTERDNFQYYLVWHRVLEVLKVGLGMVISARLLFDRYNWRSKLMPGKRRLRRRRHTEHAPPETGMA